MSFYERLAARDPLLAMAARSCTPLSVHIDITRRCNLTCAHCYAVGNPVDRLSTRTIKRFMDELAGMGTLFLVFSGGEIFLRKDLFTLLEYARKKRFTCRLLTNATLIDAAAVERLKALRIQTVDVSIYSMDSRVHDAFTGSPSSLEKSRRAVEMMAGAGLKIRVKTSITRLNVAGYDRVAQWAKSLGPGVSNLFDLTVTPMEDGGRKPLSLNLDCQAKARFLKSWIKRAEDARIEEDVEPVTEKISRSLDDPPCMVGKVGAYVAFDGEVYPCVEWRESCGSIIKPGFKKIWRESPVLRRARELKISC
ncbi:MAG: radical SAM protein, partial [Myxococcota bacterium]